MGRTEAQKLAYDRKHRADLKKRRLAEGVCVRCGDEPLSSRTYGENCLRKRLDYHPEKYNVVASVPEPACSVCGLRGEHVCIKGDPTSGLGAWSW